MFWIYRDLLTLLFLTKYKSKFIQRILFHKSHPDQEYLKSLNLSPRTRENKIAEILV